MKDLHHIEQADFDALKGDTLEVGGARMKIVEVEAAPERPKRFRKGFVIGLRPEGRPQLADGSYTVRHDKIGEHQLLVTRVMDEEGPLYEIVFG